MMATIPAGVETARDLVGPAIAEAVQRLSPDVRVVVSYHMGLNGKADFQRSGRITLKGLDYYIDERVKQLTGGKQSPVSIAPGGVPDFPIAVVAN